MNGLMLGCQKNVLSYIVSFPVDAAVLSSLMMCLPGLPILKGTILLLLAIGSYCPIGWRGMNFSGGRSYGTSLPGQNVSVLCGLWLGIGASLGIIFRSVDSRVPWSVFCVELMRRTRLICFFTALSPSRFGISGGGFGIVPVFMLLP